MLMRGKFDAYCKVGSFRRGMAGYHIRGISGTAKLPLAPLALSTT